jgi:hypothetical protein
MYESISQSFISDIVFATTVAVDCFSSLFYFRFIGPFTYVSIAKENSRLKKTILYLYTAVHLIDEIKNDLLLSLQ